MSAVEISTFLSFRSVRMLIQHCDELVQVGAFIVYDGIELFDSIENLLTGI